MKANYYPIVGPSAPPVAMFYYRNDADGYVSLRNHKDVVTVGESIEVELPEPPKTAAELAKEIADYASEHMMVQEAKIILYKAAKAREAKHV